MWDTINNKTLNVVIQENGLIRRQSDGVLIGRLTDDMSWEEVDQEGWVPRCLRRARGWSVLQALIAGHWIRQIYQERPLSWVRWDDSKHEIVMVYGSSYCDYFLTDFWDSEWEIGEDLPRENSAGEAKEEEE